MPYKCGPYQARMATSENSLACKKRFSSSLNASLSIDELHVFDKKTGLIAFVRLVWNLRKQNFTHVYDAHSNLRSHIASWILCLSTNKISFLRRSKQRFKRWLLFTWHYNLLPTPFRGAKSFTAPLEKWGLSDSVWPKSHITIYASDKIRNLIQHKNFILLAPSAAWDLKKWPQDYWKKLIKLCDKYFFVIVGGPQDHFCQEIANSSPSNSINLSGQLNWQETFEAVNEASLVISGDTGVLHMADYIQKPTLAIIGPTAFGYPSSPSSITLEVPLPCRPCTKDGRGKCKNNTFKKCLIDITPEIVRDKINETMA